MTEEKRGEVIIIFVFRKENFLHFAFHILKRSFYGTKNKDRRSGHYHRVRRIGGGAQFRTA